MLFSRQFDNFLSVSSLFQIYKITLFNVHRAIDWKSPSRSINLIYLGEGGRRQMATFPKIENLVSYHHFLHLVPSQFECDREGETAESNLKYFPQNENLVS